MDKKEIERLIHHYVGWDAVDLVGIEQAARAIAERMKAGVVWEAVGYATHLRPTSRAFDGTTTEIGDGDYWMGILPGWIGEEEKRYRVTVTTLEGEDGQD